MEMLPQLAPFPTLVRLGRARLLHDLYPYRPAGEAAMSADYEKRAASLIHTTDAVSAWCCGLSVDGAGTLDP